jgi:hypothetical protein
MLPWMSPVAARAPAPAAFEAAMLRKVNEQQKLEGEAMVKLVESTQTPAPRTDGTGTLVDTSA